MGHFAFGEHPTAVPDWLAADMEAMGMGGVALPLWFLGPADGYDVPAAMMLPMPPGYVLTRHGHPCYRFEVIVQGSLETAEGRVATVGDSFTAAPGELYGPHTAGPEGCTTFEVFSALDGMFRLLYEDADGTVKEADIRRGEYPPDFMAFPDQPAPA